MKTVLGASPETCWVQDKRGFLQPFPDLCQRLVEGNSVYGQEAAHLEELFLQWGPLS